MSVRFWTLLFLLFIGGGHLVAAQIGTCGADFLPLTSTSNGSVREQVILSSLGFAGCGRLTMCHLLAACSLGGSQQCSVEVQLWQTSASGGFTLKNNVFYQEDPTGPADRVNTLSIPLDMEFTVGDVVGFFLNTTINPFDVQTASAASHSYLQWLSSGATLSMQDATTVHGSLPILSVDGTCHSCPSSAQTPSVSIQMSSSLQDTATSDGPVSLTSNGNSFITTSTGDTTSASSSTQPLTSSVTATSSLPPTSPPTSTSPPVDTASTVMTSSDRSANPPSGVPPSSPATDSTSSSQIVTTSIAMTTTALLMSGDVAGSSESSLTSQSIATNAVPTTSVVPTTGEFGGSDASAGLVTGVVVGVVLAVVLVAVVAAIVLAVCLVRRRRRKYHFSNNEVPAIAYFVANGNAAAVQSDVPTVCDEKSAAAGVYDVPGSVHDPRYATIGGDQLYETPCEMDDLQQLKVANNSKGPTASTLLPSYEAVMGVQVGGGGAVLQFEDHYEMARLGDGILGNPTATPTGDSVSEHEYQEADDMPKSTRPLLEVSPEQQSFPIYGFVPTVAERSQLKQDDKDTVYQELEESQGELLDTSAQYDVPSSLPVMKKGGGNIASAASSIVAHERVSADTDTYWSPSSKEEEIYAQMAHRKYQEIPRHKVEISTKLGEGQFGEVYKAVLWSPTGTSQDVAVKLVKTGAPPEERLKLLQEAATLGQFRHRHVVSLYGVVTLGEPKMMVMELLPRDLKSYLDQISTTDSLRSDRDLPSLLLQFCKQVVDGLACLASKSFVHRDIAARNILLDKKCNCKISDFGMTREVESEMYYTVGKGSKIPVRWTAPEAILYKKYTTKSDIWSYGMLMYEIWSLGHKPFENNSVQEIVRLLDAHYCLRPPPGCPREVYSVMVDCWNPAHSARPTAAEILGVFCKSERVLLGWSAEEIVTPLSISLGAPLTEGETLHKDLQNKYKGSLAMQ